MLYHNPLLVAHKINVRGRQLSLLLLRLNGHGELFISSYWFATQLMLTKLTAQVDWYWAYLIWLWGWKAVGHKWSSKREIEESQARNEPKVMWHGVKRAVAQIVLFNFQRYYF